MLFIYLAILLGSYLTLSNVMQITSPLIMDLLLVPNYIIALVSYSAVVSCSAPEQRNLNWYLLVLSIFYLKKVNYLKDIHFREINFSVELSSRKQILPYFVFCVDFFQTMYVV